MSINISIRRVFIALLFLFGTTNGFTQSPKTLDLGEFNTISLNSDYKVTIRQSNTQEVIATADPEIWSATNIWVDNGTLHIDVKGNEGSKKNLLKKIEDKITGTMELSITMKNLRKIIVNGNGSVTAENSISSGILDVEMNGDGRVNVDVKATRVKASIFSQGEIQITGYADQLNLTAAGNGIFNGTNFDVKKVDANVRGSATDCTLSVSEALNIDLYGGSQVFYKGAAKQINRKIYGSGSVLFRN